jgi:PAS domain S-box-containing protein
MKNDTSNSRQNKALRISADKQLTNRGGINKKLSPGGVSKLLHELQVHQVELEMQNEELRRTQQEIEASHSKYVDLYDFAPVGYFTLDSKGTILEVNLTGTVMLGVERSQLVKKPFAGHVAKDNQDIFYFHRQQIFKKREAHRCEIALVKKDGTPWYAMLESVTAADSRGGGSHCRTVVTNISERKLAEEALHKAHDELEQRVAERTEELRQANEGLRIDIIQRKRAETAVKKSLIQVRALVARVEAVREEERTRVARMVHDELGQALTGLKLDISSIEKSCLQKMVNCICRTF